MAESDTQSPPRECGGCTMCCKVIAIKELAKPQNVWCSHCAIGTGCRIYENRPLECRTFSCGWLLDTTIPEEWRPDRSKLVFFPDGSQHVLIHVDPGTPDAWRREPYYSRLKQKAVQGAREGFAVTVVVNRKATIILPNEDLHAGVVDAGDRIVVEQTNGPDGTRLEARVVKPPAPK